MSDPVARATTVVVAGARAAEAVLLDEVQCAIESRDSLVHAALARGDAAAAAPLLAAPSRIVVPSRPLREHVASALARRTGRAVAGVVVQTHRALALAVVERAGESAPRGDALFGIAVRRAAADSAVLRDALGALRDGYASVEAVARDLSDAGFLPPHAEALDDLLAAHSGDAATLARARAVVAVTARALEALERDGAAPRAALLQRATELIALRGADALLPTRALWLYGFADATGAVTDWLLALLRALGGRALVDVPPSPFDPGAREGEFAARLLERLAAVATPAPEVSETSARAGAQLALLRAPGAMAEVRAVAARVRTLLDAGAHPESIGIVVRRPETHRVALDAQLARLAIPFSAHGAPRSGDAAARRAAALVRLLEEGANAPVDVWLAAASATGAARGGLREALHACGAGRLADLAVGDLELGAFHGVEDRVRALLAHASAWPAHGPVEAHRLQLLEVLDKHLGWSRDGEEARLFDVFDGLADELPARFVLSRAEWLLLVRRALERGVAAEIGGSGGGVQVLSAMAARGRCFESLFVLGMNRGAFPRQPVEDPLLPDALRGALQAVLPDLPIPARGYAEERHLFAELLSASPRVTLSWQFVSDEGRESARSTFVGRLLLARPDLPIESSVEPGPDDASPRRAHEHAVHAALRMPRALLSGVRTEALREVRRAFGATADGDVAAIARVQLAVLEELDPDLRTREGRSRAARPGPFLGFTGLRSGDETLFVTRIEDLARCAWQYLLRRKLQLEPVRDALAALPHLDARLRGAAAHAALERIAREAGAPVRIALDVALAGGAVEVPWPDAARIASIAHEEAARVAAEAGIRNAGFVRVLARWTEAALAVARDSDWRDGPVAVVGAELHWHTEIEDARGRSRRIGFRVDRADAASGSLRLTDYKTGRIPSEAGSDGKRAEHFLADVRRGSALQAVAYASGGRSLSARAEGRLLFLQEAVDAPLRERIATSDDAALADAFAASARIALAAHDAGAHLPRLVDPVTGDEPEACNWCEVRAACLRGESEPRRRLYEWADAAAGTDAQHTTPLREAADLAWLGRRPDAGGAQ